jgi:hypothetical protein
MLLLFNVSLFLMTESRKFHLIIILWAYGQFIENAFELWVDYFHKVPVILQSDIQCVCVCHDFTVHPLVT